MTENLQYYLSFTQPTLAECFGISLKIKDKNELTGARIIDVISSVSLDFMVSRKCLKFLYVLIINLHATTEITNACLYFVFS